MGGTDGWVYPNNWDHKKGCMMQHEPGREPTETKWEKVSGVNAGISWALSFAVSGQRPMPGSEVSRAEVLRMSTDTLLKAEAERLPDTPAPDEVVRLRAEVVEQSATIARQFELLKGVANVLKGQAGETELWSHADLPEMATRLSARVAELEAELADAKRMVCAVQPSDDHESLYCHDTVFRGVPMNWFDARDKMLSAPGKEPTSE